MRVDRRTRLATAASTAAVLLGSVVTGCGGDEAEASGSEAPPVESLPRASPVPGQARACDLLTPEEVGAYLETPVPAPEDDSFVPDVKSKAALPPMLECNYVDESTGAVVLSASVDAMDPAMSPLDQMLEAQMTGYDDVEDLTVRGYLAAYGPPIQEGGMPKIAVVAPDDPWIHVVSLMADSPAADRDTLTGLAERLLVRLGM